MINNTAVFLTSLLQKPHHYFTLFLAQHILALWNGMPAASNVHLFLLC